MRLVGDPDGIAALKELVGGHRDYLKFLIAEATSNTGHMAPFKASDGTAWQLVVHPENGDLEVRRPPAS
jgi:hypothetical protein